MEVVIECFFGSHWIIILYQFRPNDQSWLIIKHLAQPGLMQLFGQVIMNKSQGRLLLADWKRIHFTKLFKRYCISNLLVKVTVRYKESWYDMPFWLYCQLSYLSSRENPIQPCAQFMQNIALPTRWGGYTHESHNSTFKVLWGDKLLSCDNFLQTESVK